jgi:hypothetical protein
MKMSYFLIPLILSVLGSNGFALVEQKPNESDSSQEKLDNKDSAPTTGQTSLPTRAGMDILWNSAHDAQTHAPADAEKAPPSHEVSPAK